MRLAVVGAGPAGLVAALAARRRGFDVAVFEQARDFRRVGGGIALHSNGVQVLDALGVLPALTPRMRPFRTMTVERLGVGVLASVDVGVLSVPHNRVCILARYELQQFLLEAVAAAGVAVGFERRCDGATWDDGRVALRFDSGVETGFDAVVAADGIHSRLRASAALRCRERGLGWAALRGVVELPCPIDHVRELWGSDGRLFGIAPLPGAQVYFYCSAPVGRWREIVAEGRVADWVDSWRDYGPQVVELLRAVPDWQRVVYDEIGEVRVRRWYRTPLFLIGDAAHAMAPNLGQGANSAMVDALILVELLAEAEGAGNGLDRVGARYEQLRRRFVTQIQTTSRWGGVVPLWRSPLLRRAVDAAMRVQDRVGWIKHRTALLAVGYNPAEVRYLSRASSIDAL